MRKVITLLLLAVCLFTALKGTDALANSVDADTYHPVNADGTIDYETDVVLFEDNGFTAPLVGFVDNFSATMEKIKNATSFVTRLTDWVTDFGEHLAGGDLIEWLRSPIRKFFETIFEEGKDLFPWS